jgi:hypothetical protein
MHLYCKIELNTLEVVFLSKITKIILNENNTVY